MAASKGDVGSLCELVRNGHDAGAGDYDGRTPLQCAAPHAPPRLRRDAAACSPLDLRAARHMAHAHAELHVAGALGASRSAMTHSAMTHSAMTHSAMSHSAMTHSGWYIRL